MKINRKKWIVLCILYIGLLVCGTLFDQDIAAFMYNPDSMFALIVAEATYVFACYLIMLSVFILIRMYHQQGRLGDIGKIILLALGLVATSVVIFLKTSSIIVVPIHVIGYFLFWKYISTLTPSKIEQLERPAKYSLLIIIVGFLCIESLKLVMGRVRPRSVSELTPFSPWYIRNGFLYRDIVAKADEVKSFPSGHSAWSMAGITLWLYAVELKFSKNEMKLCAFVLGAWTITVMVTRLMLGAHFLSDVVVGSGIMLLSYFVFTIRYYSRYYGMRVF